MKRYLYRDALDVRASAGMLVLRVVAGAAFMFHGWSKIQKPFGWMGADGPPGIFQALAAFSEFFGGAAWIVGLLTPVASFGIFCTMAVAASTHISRGDPFVRAGGSKGGSWELATIFLSIAVVLLLAGPGKFSADRFLFRRASG